MYDELQTLKALFLGSFSAFLIYSFICTLYRFSQRRKASPETLSNHVSEMADHATSSLPLSSYWGIRIPLQTRLKLLNSVDSFLIFLFISFIGASILQKNLDSKEPIEMTQTMIVSTMIAQLFFASLPLIVISYRCNPFAFLGLNLSLKKESQTSLLMLGRYLMRYGLLALLSCILIYILLSLIQALGYEQFMRTYFNGETIQKIVQSLQNPEISTTHFILISIVAVFFAPFGEEVLFRGYLYPVLCRLTTPFAGLIFSALLFSLFHFNLYAFFPLFLLGILLAALYRYTSSLWAPMATHALFNLITVLASIPSTENL